GPVTLGLTSLPPHAVVPSILSDEGERMVLPAFFQRGRDSPDKTRQTLATAHRFGPTTPTRGEHSMLRSIRLSIRPDARKPRPSNLAVHRPSSRFSPSHCR